MSLNGEEGPRYKGGEVGWFRWTVDEDRDTGSLCKYEYIGGCCISAGS